MRVGVVRRHLEHLEGDLATVDAAVRVDALERRGEDVADLADLGAGFVVGSDLQVRDEGDRGPVLAGHRTDDRVGHPGDVTRSHRWIIGFAGARSQHRQRDDGAGDDHHVRLARRKAHDLCSETREIVMR